MSDLLVSVVCNSAVVFLLLFNVAATYCPCVDVLMWSYLGAEDDDIRDYLNLKGLCNIRTCYHC